MFYYTEPKSFRQAMKRRQRTKASWILKQWKARCYERYLNWLINSGGYYT